MLSQMFKLQYFVSCQSLKISSFKVHDFSASIYILNVSTTHSCDISEI